jgi:hypothetical protein
VRSMSGLAGKTSSPSRNDTMNIKPAENTVDKQPPVRSEGTAPL